MSNVKNRHVKMSLIIFNEKKNVLRVSFVRDDRIAFVIEVNYYQTSPGAWIPYTEVQDCEGFTFSSILPTYLTELRLEVEKLSYKFMRNFKKEKVEIYDYDEAKYY